LSDVLVIGGGHNGLVAACYLAQAGLDVQVIEARDELGGATTSKEVFKGVAAKLSRYSYLVSLLPDRIVRDLGLKFETISREISSFTPTTEDQGLLISRSWDERSESSFASVGAGRDARAWQEFYGEIAAAAPIIADTFLKPLPKKSELQGALNPDTFSLLFERPLGLTLQERFTHDLVQGIVLTDGLIGTFTDAFDSSLLANRCFLYHLVGNGSGEWRVPKGGMGALVDQLVARAVALGVKIETGVRAESIESGEVLAKKSDGKVIRYKPRFIVAAISPSQVARLQGRVTQSTFAPGSQLKINMVLEKLPRLKSGVAPELAFAGTFHFDEGMSQIQRAFAQANAGVLPDLIPAEIYSHTLADRSILSSELDSKGFHTLTLFAIHTPYQLFTEANESVKGEAERRLLAQLNRYLIDPIEECLARDSDGRACIEVKSPLDLEDELGLPEGNIFHGDLEFPFREETENLLWGSETRSQNLFLASAGARRGGGVSGIGGHNAAMAVLDQLV
jgi:phytoene dehydrogenase-like protein